MKLAEKQSQIIKAAKPSNSNQNQAEPLNPQSKQKPSKQATANRQQRETEKDDDDGKDGYTYQIIKHENSLPATVVLMVAQHTTTSVDNKLQISLILCVGTKKNHCITTGFDINGEEWEG